MSLKDRVNADIKEAMLAKDKARLQALRSIKSLILLAETEKGGTEGISQDTEMKLLTKAAKQRRESAELYAKQGRTDLEEIELTELHVIEEYLPKQLDEGDLRIRLLEIIQRVGATGPSDLGKVMGVASRELAGQADGRAISTAVGDLLNNTDF
ncbi:GatB/YqeY domain-containing protein [Pontibacter cellulosilyticus]|uniref:GatB/YqeY domain-containing protein n=1 Tax=Pontibacter cellulosilyticus TaxID=1720253 RepID=A0A923ND66_9BACT|nr:GatB/YqeY domain-containing protein [Pontibacter cellulosilyticus]MBC5994775.1 GatB/YqeY domain-containing protein [Pontibacter cellulosilyticus]